MQNTGSIVVSDGKILLRVMAEEHSSRCEYEMTRENLADAARVLGGLMNIPFEDIARECQRIHANDQLDAFIRGQIQGAIGDE